MHHQYTLVKKNQTFIRYFWIFFYLKREFEEAAADYWKLNWS